MSYIKIKLENAITNIFRNNDAFDDLNIEVGHSSEKPDLPLLCVYCYDSQPNDEMPSDIGIENVQTRIFIEAASEGYGAVTRNQLDAWIIEINNTLLNISDFQSLVNKTEEPDNREIQGLHVYDVTPSGSADDNDGLKWIEEREFVILASPEDAF